MSLLNSSTNSIPSYLLSLATFLNSYTNSSIVLLPCSTFFNSTTFIILSSPLSNYCFKSIRNCPTIIYTKFPASKFSIMFSFQISTNPPYTYNNTYCTCFSTKLFLIFILISNLHSIRNLETFSTSPLNFGGLAMFTFNPMLGIGATTATPFPLRLA